MVKCPNCKKEVSKPKKEWIYGHFEVQAYLCDNCGTAFREYTQEGKLSFVLKSTKKGRPNYVRA